MKVLVIPSWHPTSDRPIWCNWVLPHIAALREQGMDVFVLQVDIDSGEPPRGLGSDSCFATKDYIYQWVSVNREPCRRNRFQFGTTLQTYSEKLSELYETVVFSWGAPDIIHAHVSIPAGYGAAKLSKHFGVPVVVSEHYSGLESDTRYWWRIGKYYREMASDISGLYAVSPGYAKRIREKGFKVNGVLPNPIDTDLFRPRLPKESTKKIRIITVGNIGRSKGTDVLFAALELLTDRLDWHLLLIGGVQDQDVYKRWMDNPKFARRVTHPGKMDQEILARHYSESDLYVVSSRLETANVSMLQALSCGIPVVVTQCGAPETLIDDSVGMAVPVNDAEAMADAIYTMAMRITEYDPLALRAYVEERFSKRAVGVQVRNEYESILKERALNARAGTF